MVFSIAQEWMSIIYSLVARDKMVLADYSSFSGNFDTFAQQVIQKTNPNKIYGQFVTANHNYYTLANDNFIFLVMVDSKYELRIAFKFLKQIQETFFARYDKTKQAKAGGHSLTDFRPILSDWMKKYQNKEEVDKLHLLKKELKDIEEQALRNMNKLIDRGEKIEVLLRKSEYLSAGTHDMNQTAKALKNEFWWKNWKVKIVLGLTILAVITVIVLVIVL